MPINESIEKKMHGQR